MADRTDTSPVPSDEKTAAQDGDSPLYSLRDVERSYTKGGVVVQAIRGVDLDIAEGEMVALEGPSGSGKSTLLQLLGALDVPTKGSIRFAGRDLDHEKDTVLTEIRREEIGFVFQQFNLIPTLSAEENVSIAMVPRHTPRAERVARARELLTKVGLGHRLTHLPSRLSGGEQQRVAIARALANSPRVVIADEPTGNLDSTTAKEVIGVLAGLHDDEKVTLILATHDEEIARIAQRRVRLHDGTILDDRPIQYP